ncbi:RND efflux system outer membrane lipoprotein [Burkholderia pseudomallei]|uniref:TolC family protein n=1 Tax=Burkholderia pseudomallei TaxID=28450 RepID=UPI0005E70BD4|nr:TolC family protein [Burkholderia pseudomallei]CPG57202.1 RND efflux system outer membrane lipoprotein [Burkholderia pseudomallei]
MYTRDSTETEHRSAPRRAAAAPGPVRSAPAGATDITHATILNDTATDTARAKAPTDPAVSDGAPASGHGLPASPETAATLAARRATRRRRFAWFFGVLAIVALGAALYWFIVGRFSEETDDAYVAGNVVQIAAQIQGTVTDVLVADTQQVKAGQALVRLDDAEAAYAAIDGTRASFYPDVNLAALGGLFALTPASLFRHDALGGSIGPALSLPIFDRSRLKAKLGGDVANADMALALYNQTVDAALGEVARQLTSLATLDTLLKAQQQALRAAQRMVALAQDRHRRGMGMRKDIDVAQLTLLDERAHVVELQARRRTLRVGLIGALGGGFDARPASGAPPAQAGQPFAAASRPVAAHDAQPD